MDIVIVGTGVSATLLAHALVRRGCFRTLRLIGPPGPLRAHRLSYWSAVPTPFDRWTDGSWSTVSVHDGHDREVRAPLTRLVYRSFRPGAWLEAAQQEILSTPGVELVSARAQTISTAGESATVLAGGRSFAADWVFSSVREGGPAPACWQRFEGWEIAYEEGGLDESVATLLDFRTPAEGDFRFLYALPLGKGKLFLEHVSYAPSDHERFMRAYLDEVVRLKRWEIVDRERSATPGFSSAPPRKQGRLVHIGVAAGLAKTATGYALTRMWRDAERIADGLEKRGRPEVWEGPAWLFGVADHFFLHLLERAPERLPGFLMDLFERAPGDAILAFLDDQASLTEQLRVSLAAPGWLRWWALGRKVGRA